MTHDVLTMMSRRGWCHDTRGHSLDNGPVTWTTLTALTHLIKWSQTHQDIWSEKERTLNAPLRPRFKAALFMARLHLPAIKDLLKGLQSFGVAKRAWARLQLMRAKPFRYLYCLFNSMNYELGKSTRGRTYIFRRTPLWRYLVHPMLWPSGRDQSCRPRPGHTGRCQHQGLTSRMVGPVRHWQWVGTQVLWPPTPSWSSQRSQTPGQSAAVTSIMSSSSSHWRLEQPWNHLTAWLTNLVIKMTLQVSKACLTRIFAIEKLLSENRVYAQTLSLLKF